MKRQLIFLKQSFNLSSVVNLFNINVNKCNFNMTSFLNENSLKVTNNSYEKKKKITHGGLTLSQNNCNNCGKALKNVPTLNFNNRFLFCLDCNQLYSVLSSNSFHQINVLKSANTFVRRPPYPSEITAFLDKYVIGQDAAKRTLSVGVYSHYCRLTHNSDSVQMSSLQTSDMLHPTLVAATTTKHMNFDSVYQHKKKSFNICFKSIPEDDEPIRIDKSNILLLGPSGVGKTFVTQILAKVLDVPIAFGDCTSMTQAGYVGEDVESVLQKLLSNAQGSIERAQHGIVFLDEVDKIAATADSNTHSYRDVSGEGVQHALLKLVEGTVANVKSERKGPNGHQSIVQIDTTDILFIASGAFTGLEKIVGKRLDQRTVGFGASNSSESITIDDKTQEVINQKRDNLISKADQGDIIKFGMIPEMVGRFPILVPFHSLNKEMLVRVLTEPRNSIIAQMKLHFAMDDVELEFLSNSLEEIAQLALERKTGARALRSIVEKILLLAKFEVPGSDIEKIRISKNCVCGLESYEYIRRRIEPITVAAGVV